MGDREPTKSAPTQFLPICTHFLTLSASKIKHSPAPAPDLLPPSTNPTPPWPYLLLLNLHVHVVGFLLSHLICLILPCLIYHFYHQIGLLLPHLICLIRHLVCLLPHSICFPFYLVNHYLLLYLIHLCPMSSTKLLAYISPQIPEPSTNHLHNTESTAKCTQVLQKVYTHGTHQGNNTLVKKKDSTHSKLLPMLEQVKSGW